MNITNNFFVLWSDIDKEYVGLCKEYPSLSHLAKSKEEALTGIEKLVNYVKEDMKHGL